MSIAGAWLRGPSLGIPTPLRPGMIPGRGPPPRGMMPPPGGPPSLMRPPPPMQSLLSLFLHSLYIFSH